MPNGRLRRLLAHNRWFDRTDAEVGGSLLCYESVNRVRILDVEETGVTTKFRCQTFKVAEHYVRRQVTPEDVGAAK